MATVAALRARTQTQTWPRLRSCDGCGAEILLARGLRQGHPFVLEAREVFPLGRCGACRGTGHVYVHLARLGGRGNRGRDASQEIGADAGRVNAHMSRVDCYACKGAGYRGEPLTGRLVALTWQGVAYRVCDPSERQPGDALHRPHRCGRRS